MIRLTRAQVLPIGVDIGLDSIKLLQLEVGGGALSVVACARRELPDEARDNADCRIPVAVDLIRQMIRQGGFHGRHIVTALPREIAHAKHLRLPQIPPAELEAAVQFEAKNVFAFDAEDAIVRHVPAGEVRQGNDTRQEVIVLAARHGEVNTFLEQLNRAGVIIESLDFEPCALYRGVERFIRRREDEHEVHVLVDIGARCTQVVIGRGRDLTFFKPIDIAGRQFHEAVSRKLEISLEEARELRRRIIAETDQAEESNAKRDPVRQAVFDATRSVTEELAREIALCLRYHSVTFRGHRPLKVRLLGGEANDPQVQSILSATLPISVEASRPLLSVDTSRMPQNERRGRMCEWAVAFGLGLKFTHEYFGARDGRQRGTPKPAAPDEENETSDSDRSAPAEPEARRQEAANA